MVWIGSGFSITAPRLVTYSTGTSVPCNFGPAASNGSTSPPRKLTGVGITSLPGLKRAMEKSFEQSMAVGMVAVKSTIAYNRELLFREVEEADAARDFESLMKCERRLPEGFRRQRERPFRLLEDHMFHHLMKLAAEHHYPVQVHTGLHAGPNFITNSNPTLLTNLFFLYPTVKFDLFHMSYPYQEELASLAKLFPNVYVDLCWAHIIAPGATRRALSEFLETVPVNKIMGFGGDYRLVELSYAHARMARRISTAPGRKVRMSPVCFSAMSISTAFRT